MDTSGLCLHDQGDDAVTHRYSVQTEEGEVLFLFDPIRISAREVFEQFCKPIVRKAARKPFAIEESDTTEE